MSRQQERRNPAMTIALAVGATALVVVAGLLALSVSGLTRGDDASLAGVREQGDNASMPGYALQGGERVELAYAFALERPDVMLWMPCYCGCGEHSGHRNARDCFIKATSSSGNVQFEEHGSACNVCVDIAIRARELTLAGWALSDVRAAVDQEFGDIGPGTDTPQPPE